MPYQPRPETRETLINQVTQTAPVAAFIGGFAFKSLSLRSDAALDVAIYVMTCSDRG